MPRNVTYESLYELHRSIITPTDFGYVDPGLGVLGLILLEHPNSFKYDQTPQNSLTFSHYGWDGIHIGCLTEGHSLDANAPVLVTIPMAGLVDKPTSYVLGANLYEFLCLGANNGFGSLCNLHMAYSDTLTFLESPTNLTGHDKLGADYVANYTRVIESLVHTFDLVPPRNLGMRFEELRATYYDRLDIRCSFH